MSERRIRNTNSTNIPLLLPILNAMDFKTTASHRGTTPIGQRLDGELNQQIQFQERQLNEPNNVNDQFASQDEVVDLDADTQLLYEPAREITPPTPRRNRERTRRKPKRYGQVEVTALRHLTQITINWLAREEDQVE